MKSWIAGAVVAAVSLAAGASFAASGSSGLDASSSAANNQVGSAPAGGGSMINPGGVERPKNADVYPSMIPGGSTRMRSDSGRDPMQNSTLGSASTAPRGDSR
jgi:hypothetical protein